MKKSITYQNGRNGASHISHQSGRHRIAGTLDAHRTEIEGNDVESSIGRSLKETAEPSWKRIGTKLLHGLHHHGLGPTTAERLHERSRKRIDKIGIRQERETETHPF